MEKNFSSRVFTVAELVAEVIGSEGAVNLLKKAVIEYYERVKDITEKLKAAEENEKKWKEEKEGLLSLLQERNQELTSSTRQLSEARDNLSEAEKEKEHLTNVLNNVKHECVETQRELSNTTERLTKENEKLDKAENLLRLTIETMAAFRKSTPSEKSFLAFLKALEKNFGFESRDTKKDRKKKK